LKLLRQHTFSNITNYAFFCGLISYSYYKINYDNHYVSATNISATSVVALEMFEHVDASELLNVLLKLKSIENSKFFHHELDKTFVEHVFHHVGINDDEFIDSIFNTIDSNGDGKLKAYELSAVISLLRNGDMKQRFDFLFECMDLDKNGVIEKLELQHFLATLFQIHYKLEAQHHKNEFHPKDTDLLANKNAERIATQVFDFFDVNHDGVLSRQEFLTWCEHAEESEIIKQLLLETFGF